MTKQLTAIGSYIFAGGFTIGVEESFKVLAHMEGGPYGVKTFKLNRPEIPVYQLPTPWPWEQYKGVNFIYANPPCSPFSVAGRSIYYGKDNWRTDPRMACHDHCFELAYNLNPDAYCVESVPAAFTRGRELFDRRAEEAMSSGYAVTHLLEDARYFGIPQKRKRYMFIAHKHELVMANRNWQPPVPLLPFLNDLPEAGFFSPFKDPAKLELVKHTPQGRGTRGTWLELNPDQDKWQRSATGVKGRPRFCEYRAAPDRPMGAYIGNFVIHPTEHRFLGLEEVKAFCGFPHDWKFHDERKAFSEIARGVLPPVGAWVARSIAQAILSGARATPSVRVLDLSEPLSVNND